MEGVTDVRRAAQEKKSMPGRTPEAEIQKNEGLL